MPLEGTRSQFARIAFTSLLLAVAFLTPASALYVKFHYPAVMPRSPQPETGRVYPMRFKGQSTVYVSKKELDRSDFVKYRLMPLFGLTMILYFGIGTRLDWWTVRPKTPFVKF
jgi:hypothetical protein